MINASGGWGKGKETFGKVSFPFPQTPIPFLQNFLVCYRACGALEAFLLICLGWLWAHGRRGKVSFFSPCGRFVLRQGRRVNALMRAARLGPGKSFRSGGESAARSQDIQRAVRFAGRPFFLPEPGGYTMNIIISLIIQSPTVHRARVRLMGEGVCRLCDCPYHREPQKEETSRISATVILPDGVSKGGHPLWPPEAHSTLGNFTLFFSSLWRTL